MTNLSTRAALAAGLYCLAFVSCPSQVLAQTSVAEEPSDAELLRRIEELEKQLREAQASLGQLRAVFAREGRRDIASSVEPICRMATSQDVAVAHLKPNRMTLCLRDVPPPALPVPARGVQQADAGATSSPTAVVLRSAAISLADAQSEAARQYASQASQPLPDRANIAPGLSTTLEFSGSTRLSVDYNHPVIYRTVGRSEFNGFSPQLLTIRGGLSVAQERGENVFFSDTERPDRDDEDILSGTTFKFGIDFLSFQRISRDRAFRRTLAALHRARTACLADFISAGPMNEGAFFAQYGLVPDPRGGYVSSGPGLGTGAQPRTETAPRRCSDADLMDYIFEAERDPENGAEVRFRRPALVAAYQASFWDADAQAIPQWGAGFSLEYGTTDFRYRQGIVDVERGGPLNRFRALLRPDTPLETERSDSEDTWKLQAYASYFLPTRGEEPLPTSRFHTQGVMALAGIGYSSSAEFRPGTTGLTLCPRPQELAPPGIPVPQVLCSVLNVDRPVISDFVTLSGELRTQFNNVPVLGVLGFAPRYSYRLEDGAQTIDVPVYLSANAKGWGSAGLRLRHSWNGLDVLNNERLTATEISIFISPALNFRGF